MAAHTRTTCSRSVADASSVAISPRVCVLFVAIKREAKESTVELESSASNIGDHYRKNEEKAKNFGARFRCKSFSDVFRYLHKG